MKTRFFMPAWALMCAAVLFSCTDKIETPAEEPVENPELHEYTITAFSEDSGTKAELGTGNYIFWQEGDMINLISKENATENYCFTLSDGVGTNEGTFSGEVENPGADYAGIYPYNEKNAFTASGGNVNWGKYKQCAIEEGFDPEACLMAGITDSEGNISFKNLCSYIKFTTDFDCKSIVLTCMDKAQCFVSPKIIFSLDENGTPNGITPIHYGDNIFDPLPTVSTLTLVGKDGGIIPAGTYYVAVLPTTYNGISFTFTTKFDKTVVKATKKTSSNPDVYAPITIDRNVIANVGSFLIDNLLPSGSNDFYGAGTESDPYLISSLGKLQKFAEIFSAPGGSGDYAGKHFLQTTDIDCLGNEISIGSERQNDDDSGFFDKNTRMFSGVYDGGGYTISNYKLKPWSTSGDIYAGLFYQVYQGTIQNLNIRPAVGNNNEIVNITSGDYSKEIVVGALIAKSGAQTPDMSGDDGNVTVTNCHLLGQEYRIGGTRSTVFGGLIGRNVAEKLTMVNCSNKANLVAGCDEDDGYENKLGGLIGELEDSRLAGESYAEHLVIDRCRNNGNISLISTDVPCFAGGFVGFLSASKLEAHVSNSVNSGAVMTSSNAIWEKYDKFSETCGPSCAGGFFGFLDEDESTSYFHNCLNKGSIEAYSEYTYARAGGFIGYSRENNNVSQGDQSGSKDHVYAAMCVNTGSIVGHTDNKGSFCGTINGMKCVNCMWLDEHNYGDGVRAALPYRPKLDDQAGGNYDTVHDVYYYKSIDTSTIAAAFKKMTDAKTDGGRACRYDDDKFQLRWGTLDEWKEWAVAWKGQAVWNGSNTLDLDFTALLTLR